MTLKYYSYSYLCYFRNTNISGYSFGKYVASKYIRIFIRYIMWHPNIFGYCSCPFYDIRSSLGQISPLLREGNICLLFCPCQSSRSHDILPVEFTNYTFMETECKQYKIFSSWTEGEVVCKELDRPSLQRYIVPRQH